MSGYSSTWGVDEPGPGPGTPGPDTVAYRLVALPGDGIGPDVLAAGRRVLDAAGELHGFRIEWQELLIGGCAIDAYGVPLRDEDAAACEAADAIFLGAVGGPKWDDPNAKVRPEQGLLGLRKRLDLFANIRPVSVEESLIDASTIRPEVLRGVDLIIIRELTGGLYFGKPSEERQTPEGRAAVDTLWYTEGEIARVARVAFQFAEHRRKKVTSVDKANVLASSRLWRKVVTEVAAEFPGIELEHRLVDAAAMALVRQPAAFDVIVTENMFGDILSDEASMISGSLGLLPSASFGTSRSAHGARGLYEPIHGSAPDIAGTDIANPIGSILSGSMLLRWSLGQNAAGDAVEAAVVAALRDGYRTPDLASYGGAGAVLHVVGTAGFTDQVVARLAAPSAGG
jgi:3-isopropylmalate dehydrogenase